MGYNLLKKENEGVGVRKIKEFNFALSSKWGWRMHIQKDSLWFKVLAARYGLEEGRVSEGGCVGSVWWNQLQDVSRGDGLEVGRWFANNLVRVVEILGFGRMDSWREGRFVIDI